MAQQTIDIGAAPNDGLGDPIRDAFDKCNDNFTELYTGLTGLLDFKGSTDCSANPNYPAASKGDYYLVSVAGKIGGASGTVVEIGDSYFAIADNAGGTQAAVGASWAVVQGNVTSIAAGVDVEDEGVSETVGATTLNFTGAGVTAADAGGGAVDITIPGGGGTFDLGDADDVDTTGAATGNVLEYDGAEWVPAAPSGVALVLIDEQSPSGVATVTFSAIAATYRDLVVVVRGRCDQAATASTEIYLRINGDTGNNYDQQRYQGSATSNLATQVLATDKINFGWVTAATAPAGAAGSGEATIYNYRDTTFQKMVHAGGTLRNGTVSGSMNLSVVAGDWRNTAAITSIDIHLAGGNFVAGTIASLYGRM